MPDIKQVIKDFKAAHKARKNLNDEIKKDFEYALGKQWNDEDVETLRKAGVKALTINKLRPQIKLLSGIERQSRSDFLAFPEGKEDGISADVVTRLLKHLVKVSKVDRKLSDQFKHGIIGGEYYLEPYQDFTHDLLNGELKWKPVSARRIFPDPKGQEYDLSDRRYIIKFSPGLSRDEVEELFPDQEKKIDKIEGKRIDFDLMEQPGPHIQKEDYPETGDGESSQDDLLEDSYDLIEYYYKKQVDRYYVADRELGVLKEAKTQEEAEAYGETHPEASILKRKVPEMRLKQVIGNTEMSDEVCWSYPKWKTFPFIPFFAEVIYENLGDLELTVQGLIRGIRDLQEEYNKRRTQSLRHINSSVNSGWIYPKGAVTGPNKGLLEGYGSSPGVTIEYDPEKAANTSPQSWRITPTPLSQGHEQLAAENAQDMKEAGGVNPDLLANDNTDQSGRAILLKQRQGLVMVQEVLDNYALTKQLLGKFLLSQLGEFFTVETAVRVIGDRYLQDEKAFHKPVMDEEGKPQLDEMGEIETKIDEDLVKDVFNKILNDTSLGKYDVSIGEGPYNETIQAANSSMLIDMASKGLPIDPALIIEESLLSDGTKRKIITKMEQLQAQPVPVDSGKQEEI